MLVVKVVYQILIVSVGVAGLDVTINDAVAVVDRFKYRNDGVGGTAGR